MKTDRMQFQFNTEQKPQAEIDSAGHSGLIYLSELQVMFFILNSFTCFVKYLFTNMYLYMYEQMWVICIYMYIGTYNVSQFLFPSFLSWFIHINHPPSNIFNHLLAMYKWIYVMLIYTCIQPFILIKHPYLSLPFLLQKNKYYQNIKTKIITAQKVRLS